MAITTYAELQTAVGNWLNRGDLTARIPEFITLAEAKVRRVLRDRALVGALSLSVGDPTKTLGAAVKELISLRYNTGVYYHNLIRVTPTALADFRRAGSGMPTHYTVINGIAYFDVAPDTAYVLDMTYIEKLTALSAGVTTTFTNNPDLYLYGALAEAEPYLEHDERAGMWGAQFAAAIQDENTYRERAELGGGLVEMRLPVVFGDFVP